MPLQLNIAPMALFAFVASITPGPNNLLLMRSGANFGVRRSLGHLFGVQAGFVALMVLAHLGIGAALLAVPATFTLLRWGCFAYLLWLTFVILRDAQPRPVVQGKAVEKPVARPMSFFEGMMFQVINPKAWMMAVTVASAFYGSAAPAHLDLAVAAVICVAIGNPCMLVWTAWGAAIDHVLKGERARRLFAYFMAALVAATAIWMLL